MATAAAAWRVEAAGEPDDVELVREVLRGSSATFERLVHRHEARVRRVVRRVMRDRVEAEDVVQQTFLRAFASLEAWTASAPFAMWLTRIAINEALMRVRRSRRLTQVETQLARHADAPRHTPEQLAASREEVARVSAAIPRLPARHREILQLTTLHDLPRADVARRLGVTEGVVKVRLHRAREALRGLLREPRVPARGATPRLALAGARRSLIGSGAGEEVQPA